MDIDVIRDRQDTIARLALDGHLISVAWSGGKDSSVALSLAVEGYKAAARQGRVYPLFVITSDTGIENPAVSAYIKTMADHLADYARKEGIDVRIITARPNLASSWPVQIIGGRSLPIFVNSASRSCSIDLKRDPARRALAMLIPELRGNLEASLATGGDLWETTRMIDGLAGRLPLTIVGTRFGESTGRDQRMAARGDIAGQITRNEDGYDVLPLIADLDTDDVWEFLALAGTDPGKKYPAFAPNFEATIEIYRDAAGECVIVAGLKNDQVAACGARHGCSLCTVTGNADRSMETMLVQPKYGYMQGLNDLRNWLAAGAYDWSLRRFIGRTTDPVTGYIKLAPDVYSAATCADILAFALTIDVREKERAANLADAMKRHDAGMPVVWPDHHLAELATHGEFDEAYARRMTSPQFQLIDAETLIMIDFSWSRYGLHAPFHALAIYRDIYLDGMRVDVPPRTPAPRSAQPPTRWIAPHPKTKLAPGLYDAIVDVMSEGCPGTYARTLADGTPMVSHEVNPIAEIDPEALAFFIEYDLERLLKHYHDEGTHLPAAAAEYYLRTGLISLPSNQGSNSATMVRHHQHLAMLGLHPADADAVGTISDQEHSEIKKAAKFNSYPDLAAAA